jgi:hypothetical protein
MIDIKRKGQIRVKHQVRLLLRLLRFRLTVNIQDRLLFKHMCCELEHTCRSEMVSFYEGKNCILSKKLAMFISTDDDCIPLG